MDQRALFPLIRNEVLELLNHYLNYPRLLNGIDAYIVPPHWVIEREYLVVSL